MPHTRRSEEHAMRPCRYCPRHARALVPAGYDLAQARRLPAHWHPLPVGALLLAIAVGRVFGCAPVVVETQTCDVCAAEAAKDVSDGGRVA